MDYARTGFQLFRVLGNHLRNRSTTQNIVGEFLRDDTHCFMEIHMEIFTGKMGESDGQ